MTLINPLVSICKNYSRQSGYGKETRLLWRRDAMITYFFLLFDYRGYTFNLAIDHLSFTYFF